MADTNKLEELGEWIKTEATIIEGTVEHSLIELKSAFARGILELKDALHLQKQQKLNQSLSNAISPPAQAELKLQPTPETTNTGASPS